MIVKSEESLRLYALGALAWLGFVAFILTGLFTTVRQAPFVAIPFFGVFLVFAVWIAGKLLSRLGAYVNFGTVRLALERAPKVGGELKGQAEFETGAAAGSTVEAELVCNRATPRANDASSLKDVVHTESIELLVRIEQGRRVAAFAFAIPVDANPTGEEEDRKSTRLNSSH